MARSMSGIRKTHYSHGNSYIGIRLFVCSVAAINPSIDTLKTVPILFTFSPLTTEQFFRVLALVFNLLSSPICYLSQLWP